MLRWIILGLAVAAAAVGGCLVHSSMTPEKVSAQPTDDPNQPFAVCWTDKPLGKLANPPSRSASRRAY